MFMRFKNLDKGKVHRVLHQLWEGYLRKIPVERQSKEKVQKDKQQSTTHTYKTKNRVTRTSLKTGGELRYSGRIGSSCSTSGTLRVNLVTNNFMTKKMISISPL
jgi:hypothetical protein